MQNHDLGNCRNFIVDSEAETASLQVHCQLMKAEICSVR